MTTVSKEKEEPSVLRIKRKRNDSALEAFVVETQHKKAAVEELVHNFANLDTVSDTTAPLSLLSESENKKDKFQDRKLFRLAFTITDTKKVKEFSRGLQKIQIQNSRNKVVSNARQKDISQVSDTKEETVTNPGAELFVIDVYYRDSKTDVSQLESFDVVRLESWKDDLVFDGEYDSFSDDSEDSNAKEWDYPEEEELEDECSDDSSEGNRPNNYHHRNAFDDSDNDLEDDELSSNKFAFDPSCKDDSDEYT